MGPDSLVWRRWAHFGAARAPRWFARSAPGPIAWLLAPFLGRARRALIAHQRLIVGRRGPVTEYFAAVSALTQYAHCLTEALGASRADARPPEVEVRGGDALTEVLGDKRGLLVCTAHVGPWEGAAAALAARTDRPVLLVMAEERDPEAARFEDEMRQERGLAVVRLGQQPLAALPILEHLQAGGIAAVQIDRPSPGGATMLVDLFDRPTPFPEGPFRLALSAGVPLLPVFAARLGYGRRLVVIGRPVWPAAAQAGSRRERALLLARQVAQELEAHLRAFPTQWFHFVEEPFGGEAEATRPSAPSGRPTAPKRPGRTRTKVA